MYSSGTIGTGKPVHFTEYGGFRISGGLFVHKHNYVNTFRAKQSVRNIIDGCVCKAGFHCTPLAVSELHGEDDAGDVSCERVRVNNHGTRGNNKLQLSRPKTDFFKKSFSFRGVQDWNSLPINISQVTQAGDTRCSRVL